jgi:hypothetical protein
MCRLRKDRHLGSLHQCHMLFHSQHIYNLNSIDLLWWLVPDHGYTQVWNIVWYYTSLLHLCMC